MGSDIFKPGVLAVDLVTFKHQSRAARSIRDLFNPEPPPPIQFPEEEEPTPLVDEDAARRLALQRRSIEQRRSGRSSLRIDRPVRSPGVAAGTGSGLRIP